MGWMSARAEEALLEANLDEREGADIIMVKPGLPYLDVLRKVAITRFDPLPSTT